MKCVIESELTPSRFSELGDPYRIFHDRERGLVAIASRMPHLGYPGRWLFPEVYPSSNRLSIYREADGSLVGCISTKFPINDVSFSPVEDSVVIATGSYDGGWFFEGYLLRFNWSKNEAEQLLGQSREFVACRHEPNGAITALMRPENEEEFWEAKQLDAWSIVLAVTFDGRSSSWKGAPVEVSREDARQSGLIPSVPSDHGFSDEILTPTSKHHRVWRREAMDWLEHMGAELYAGIWDVKWLDRETLAFVANGVALERRSVSNGVLNRERCEGNGVELIQHPRLGLLSHVQFAGQHGGTIDTRSELWQWSNRKQPTRMRFERPYAFSFDHLGNGLAIDISWANQREHKSLLLGPSGQTLQTVDCGASDRLGPTAFPHGLDTCYFLRREGEQAFSNNDYRLWRVENAQKTSPVRVWNTLERDFCPVVSVACSRTTMLGAGSVWNRDVHQRVGWFMKLIELASGREIISGDISSSPTCVALSQDRQTAIIGFVDGRIGLFDLGSGSIISEVALPKRHTGSVPISLSVHENRLLVGTHDGRVLLAGIHP